MRTLRLEQLDGGLSDGGERSSVRYCCTRKDAARDRYFGGRGQGYIGPKGRNVLLDKSFGAPRISKDGVAVAKEIELADRFENIGAQMLKEVAVKTGELAGDGTTTATVLAQAIVNEGAKAVVAGMSPMDLKRGVDMAVGAIVDDVRKRSRKVSTSEEIAQIATVSANGAVENGR